MPDAAARIRQATPAPAAKPKRREIEHYLEVDEKRREHGREASRLKKEQDALSRGFMAYVAEAGGRDRRVRTCGYELAIETRHAAGRCDYRQALVDAIGEPAVAALEAEAAATTTPRDQLVVRKH